jgi:hypothetical protein
MYLYNYHQHVKWADALAWLVDERYGRRASYRKPDNREEEIHQAVQANLAKAHDPVAEALLEGFPFSPYPYSWKDNKLPEALVRNCGIDLRLISMLSCLGCGAATLIRRKKARSLPCEVVLTFCVDGCAEATVQADTKKYLVSYEWDNIKSIKGFSKRQKVLKGTTRSGLSDLFLSRAFQEVNHVQEAQITFIKWASNYDN